MPGIVCAIRGGPASQPTILKAINLAQEIGLPVYYLYIVNLDFLERTASSRTHTITKELRQMGEFILLAAQAQSQEQGIAAEGVVRDGNVGDEIIKYCQEIQADYIVLGRPQGEHEDNVFTSERMHAFGQIVEQLSGSKAIFAEE